MRKLDAGVHVVSGTPGRVKDMMEKQKVTARHALLLWFSSARASFCFHAACVDAYAASFMHMPLAAAAGAAAGV
jgi:hypothetical protein